MLTQIRHFTGWAARGYVVSLHLRYPVEYRRRQPASCELCPLCFRVIPDAALEHLVGEEGVVGLEVGIAGPVEGGGGEVAGGLAGSSRVVLTYCRYANEEPGVE
ncbi:MAG: hypothetical protein QGG53_20170 [Planctomycetota bacterium]|nr:hypothetical protein [Planctomycetota bacterium]